MNSNMLNVFTKMFVNYNMLQKHMYYQYHNFFKCIFDDIPKTEL